MLHPQCGRDLVDGDRRARASFGDRSLEAWQLGPERRVRSQAGENAILEHGGRPQACGWIIDRYGVRWQIVPALLGKLMADPDPVKARRTSEEMLKQVKLDIAKLQAAHDGR